MTRAGNAGAGEPKNTQPSLEKVVEHLSQLQGGETNQGQDRGDDPEADDDGRLLPALLLEMMMQWRHGEDALARELEGRDLDDHRDSLEHEQSADDGEDDLVLDDDRDGAQRATERASRYRP